MAQFPTLKTGAILQYPAQKATKYSTQVLRFLDGSEQRFRNYASPLRKWTIRLDLLDEAELHALREFFRTAEGAAGSFTFTDPWDGARYPNCSLEPEAMIEEIQDEMKSKTSLTVRVNR